MYVMSSVRDFIKNHKFISAFMVIGVILIVLVFSKRYVDQNRIYQSGLTETDRVPYINIKYEDNEYKNIVVPELDMVDFYYNNFKEMLLKHPDDAWNLISEDSKLGRFNNSEERFNDYVTTIINADFKKAIVEKYSYKKGASYNTISIVDTTGRYYIFYEYGVWKYRVSIGDIVVS